MLRFAFVVLAVMMLVTFVVALVVSALVLLAMACVIGLPIYLATRMYVQRHNAPRVIRSPIERLQDLYAEGKIDLVEFERRVARLVAIEH